MVLSTNWDDLFHHDRRENNYDASFLPGAVDNEMDNLTR